MPTRPSPSVVVVLLAVLIAVPAAAVASGSPLHPGPGGATSRGSAGRIAPGAPPRGVLTGATDRTPLARSGGSSRVDGPSRGGSSPPIFPPNPRRPRAAPGLAPLTALYPSVPAPMGVSDVGVGTNGSYEYGTQSFEGNVTLTSFSAFTPTNGSVPTEPSPDWVLLQLDAVAVNVSLPPASAHRTNGTFWVQNGVQFNGTTVQLEDNIWNFSINASSVIPSTTLTGGGTIVDGSVYVRVGPNFTVTRPSAADPLRILLWDNITNLSGHTVVTFGYAIGGHGGTYDTVTFGGAASAGSPPQFLVDGAKLNPVGLLYDVELVFGGLANGANANLEQLNGSAAVDRLQSSVYQSVPSAFDFGSDTAETALGVAVAYTGTTAQLSAGPSFLVGLWGTGGTAANRLAPQAKPNWITVTVEVTPSYALAFATNVTAAAGPLRYANYSFAPTDLNGVLTTDLPPLPPGQSYVFTAWADGYLNGSVEVNTSGVVNLTLTASSLTLDAPVYLRGTAQALAFAAAKVVGTGYAAGVGTVWLNRTADDLAPPFLRVNEMDYPTFTLLATDGVDLALAVNGFVQAPATFNYSENDGKVVELVGWTQGYFFYYGSGNLSVGNTTIAGVPPRSAVTPAIDPPSTVEFYRTNNVAVGNLTADDDAIGVTAIATSSVRVVDLLAEGGAVGLSTLDATRVTVERSNATGDDPSTLIPSTLVFLNATTSATLSNLTVSDSASGVGSQGGDRATIAQLAVESGGTGLVMNDTGDSTVTGLSVIGGLAAAGVWANSTQLSFTGITVNGSGLVLTGDSSVTVDEGSATGLGSTVVQTFQNSTAGTFRELTATDGAIGADLVYCTNVVASSITATDGSVGVVIANASDVSGSGYASDDLSVGLALENVSRGTSTFSYLNTSDDAIGAYVANSTDVLLTSLIASNATLGDYGYFANASFQTFPIAAVGLYGDHSVNVTGVTALNYPFGVWSNATDGLEVYSLLDWYGGEAVALNYTNDSTVNEVFAFADLIGVEVQNSTDTEVEGSTLEASAGVGVWLVNGKDDSVDANNFVANNNSSVHGGYDVSRLQAYSNGSVDPTFRGNYWADRTGGSYVINATGHTSDASPHSSFYAPYLEFTESGLPARTNWTVLLGSQNYTMNDSVLYLPGWALPAGALPFTVPRVLDLPPHPAVGTVTWAGATLTEAIVFGTPSSPSAPIPLWVWGAVGGAVVAVAIGVVLLARRSRGGGPPTTRYRPGMGVPPRGGAPGGGTRPGPGSDDTPDWLTGDQR